MHINFAKKRGFDFSLKSLKGIKLDLNSIKQIEFNRLTMVVIAGVALFLMVTFGLIQKFRLDSFNAKKIKAERTVAEMREKGPQTGAKIVESGGQFEAVKKYEDRILWSDVLNRLSESIPRRIWLGSIKSGEKGNSEVEVSGDAPDQAAVAELIGALEKNRILKDVKLVSSDATTDEKAGRTKLKFVLTCRLK